MTLTDPLAPIGGQQIDDAVLRLLLGEYLFENGHAHTIDGFHLGPARGRRRHIRPPVDAAESLRQRA